MVNHIGLIPDGNRRWAEKNNMDLETAYAKSMDHICEFIQHFFSLRIPFVSVYLLSSENLKRNRFDLDKVITAETNLCISLLKLCEQWKCKVVHAGRTDILPENLADGINSLVNATSHLETNCLNLLLGYSPLDEINAAIKDNAKEITLQDLWVKEKLDIVVRTAGGNVALSNFLPLQSGYAQLFIVEELFNDFSTKKFDELLNTANKANLLFGK